MASAAEIAAKDLGAKIAEAEGFELVDGATVLSDMIDLMHATEQELQRRRVDLKWREAHKPEQATDYRAERVTPVERNLLTISRAVAALRAVIK